MSQWISPAAVRAFLDTYDEIRRVERRILTVDIIIIVGNLVAVAVNVAVPAIVGPSAWNVLSYACALMGAFSLQSCARRTYRRRRDLALLSFMAADARNFLRDHRE